MTSTTSGRHPRRRLWVSALVLLLVCTCAPRPALSQAPDKLIDVSKLMDDGQYGRVLALLRPEIANPQLAQGKALSDIRILALQCLGRLATGHGIDAATDAEVAGHYAGAVRHAGDDDGRKALARAALAFYYQGTNRPGRTLPLLFEDLAYQRRRGDLFAQVGVLASLADAFAGAGMSPQAGQYRREAIATVERAFRPQGSAKVDPNVRQPPEMWVTYRTMLVNVASEAADAGDPAGIDKFGPAILAINDRFMSPRFFGYLSLAELYASAGNGQKAQRLFEQGRQLFVAERPGIDPAKVALADTVLTCSQATVDASRSRQEASRLMDACLDGYRRAGITPSFETRLQAGRVYERTGAADKALEQYGAGIEALGTLRGSYTVAERVAFMNLPAARKLYWGRLRVLAQKARAAGTADSFIRAFAAADEFRARQLGELADLDGAAGPPDYAAFVASLPPGTLVLGLTVMDDRTVVMASDGATRRITEIPTGRTALDRDVRALLDGLSDQHSSVAALGRALQAYSARLLGEVRPMLQGRKAVVVALDGPAALIPPTLFQVDSASDTPLGLASDVSVTPAFRFVARQRPGSGATRFLGLGDPAFPPSLRVVDVPPDTAAGHAPGGRLRSVADGGVSVPPLPETRDEVTAIARLFPDPSRLLLGPDATKAAVQRADLSGVGFLHLATHGLLPGDIEGLAEPALVLAPGPDGDALLRSSEAEKLDLRAVELTVLSACSTGSGQVYAGEGVMGLSRAFLAAGSRAVVVSMWPVASRGTEVLMVEFYRQRQSGLPLAQALRAAMAAVRRIDPHPSIWAPFVVVRAG